MFCSNSCSGERSRLCSWKHHARFGSQPLRCLLLAFLFCVVFNHCFSMRQIGCCRSDMFPSSARSCQIRSALLSLGSLALREESHPIVLKQPSEIYWDLLCVLTWSTLENNPCALEEECIFCFWMKCSVYMYYALSTCSVIICLRPTFSYWFYVWMIYSLI